MITYTCGVVAENCKADLPRYTELATPISFCCHPCAGVQEIFSGLPILKVRKAWKRKRKAWSLSEWMKVVKYWYFILWQKANLLLNLRKQSRVWKCIVPLAQKFPCFYDKEYQHIILFIEFLKISKMNKKWFRWRKTRTKVWETVFFQFIYVGMAYRSISWIVSFNRL